MDYKIVSLDTVPDRILGARGGKWTSILDNLPAGKAAMFTFPNTKIARATAMNISQSARNNRRPYKIHTRSIMKGNTASLYVWKEILPAKS